MSLSETCVSRAVSVLNAGGKLLARGRLRLPDLRPEALERSAVHRARLEHFGPWPFREPLDRLMSAYEAEADLTMLGRLTVRELIVSLLENLLYLEEERRRRPEVEKENIRAPVFIIGLPRTGTTLLHGLMGRDPANRVPLTWEVMFPAYPNDPDRIRSVRQRASRRLAWANRLAPEFRRIHPIAPDLPQECIAITAQVFTSIQFHTTHNVPSYEDWFERSGQDLGYAFHYRFLQHLQSKRRGGRWVLKAPGHLFGLEALLKRYPDAKIVQTHRDPLRVMASMASHATVLRRAFSDRAEPEKIAADWAARWASALEGFLQVRDRSEQNQFLDVTYEAIEEAPLETMERIYDFLDQPMGSGARQAMTEFLAANPKNKHGAHRYSLSEYGLDRDTELRRFSRYCERFRIAVQAE
jgi:hypothetical protein